MSKIKIGFIPAHRDMMDEEYAVTTKKLFEDRFRADRNIEVICPNSSLTCGGLVRNLEDAKKVSELFYEHKIDCIVLGAITFGDERSALTIIEKFYGLPVFIFAVAEPDIPDGKFFKSAAPCGLLPITFGLKRRNVKFTFGGVPKPAWDMDFAREFERFVRTVLAVKKFRNARVGMLGDRPNDFEVCAFNEALMINRYNQKITHINMLDLKFEMESIPDDNEQVTRIIKEIITRTCCSFSEKELLKVAKLEVQILKYIKDFNLDALSIECWTSIQKYIGVTPCLTNSRITDIGYPVSCEGDVNNALTMLVQKNMTFGTKAPMILDMLTLHPDENDLMLVWHCGNVSISNKAVGVTANVMPQCPWENEYGRERAAASIEFLIKSGVVTANCLVEHNGCYKMLAFEGLMVNIQNNIRGAWSWMKVKDRDKIYKTMVNEGFTHHLSLIHEDISEIVMEFCHYLDIQFVKV